MPKLELENMVHMFQNIMGLRNKFVLPTMWSAIQFFSNDIRGCINGRQKEACLGLVYCAKHLASEDKNQSIKEGDVGAGLQLLQREALSPHRRSSTIVSPPSLGRIFVSPKI